MSNNDNIFPLSMFDNIKAHPENYRLIEFAGTDNHKAAEQERLAGMCSDKPILDEQDFVQRVKNLQMKVFTMNVSHAGI